MAEYIEREAAINAVYEAYADGESAYDALIALPAAFEDAQVGPIPAADVRPVVRGKWISKYPLSTCSVCEESMILCDFANFCPNCGADMRGEQT